MCDNPTNSDHTPVPGGPAVCNAQRRRRGSILIFALGMLAVVAILALSYVSTVRIDRTSSAAVARQANYQQQVNAVTSHIGALLAADLFGNKIATRSVPAAGRPTMFEDGEYWDYPSVDDLDPSSQTYTFNRNATILSSSNQNPQPSANAVLAYIPGSGASIGRFDIAPPDDAWLSATEPLWNPAGPVSNNGQVAWPQVTNLRSAYIYRDNVLNTSGPTPGNLNDDGWVRMDGRFADLARPFLDLRAGNLADAGADLTSRELDQSQDARIRLARFGSNALPIALNNEEYTHVYHRQMARGPGFVASPVSNPTNQFTPADERFWADTDGDLRPDARWQQLESMGNLFGLTWVTCVRIIDASSMVNINTAMDGGTSEMAKFADGRTPADVDLFRLMSEPTDPSVSFLAFSNPSISYDNLLGTQYRAHLQDALGVSEQMYLLFTDSNPMTSPHISDLPYVENPADTSIPYFDDTWQRTQILTPLQRAAFYEFVGTDPERPLTDLAGGGYPLRDLIDLMSYWGTNDDRNLSKFEERMDGPADSGGFLPGAGGTIRRVGPMRARETGTTARQFASAPDEQKPTLTQMKESVRRFLTTINGVGRFGPVPVLNKAQDFSARSSFNQRINLRNITRTTFPDLFEGFMWALAPLAGNEPLVASTNPAPAGIGQRRQPLPTGRTLQSYGIDPLSTDIHYGGSAANDGLAERLIGQGTGAEFAFITSGAMAANVIDATDVDDDPTVARLFNNVTQPIVALPDPTSYIEHGSRFDHGDVETGVLPSTLQSWTVVGLDRQPFLREVFIAGAYSDYSAEAGDENGVIGPIDAIGSIFAVEIANPWPGQIRLDNYRIVLPIDGQRDISGSNAVELEFDGSALTLDPGESRVYWIARDSGAPGFPDIQTELVNQFGSNTAMLTVAGGGSLPGAFSVFFQEWEALCVSGAGGPQQSPTLLMYDNGTDLLLVDRMTPPGVTEVLPAESWFGSPIDAEGLFENPNIHGPTAADVFTIPYLINVLGYDPMHPAFTQDPEAPEFVPLDQLVTGRALVTYSVSRPCNQRPMTGGGFPSYVFEFTDPQQTDECPVDQGESRNLLKRRIIAQAWLKSDPPPNFPEWVDPMQAGTLVPDLSADMRLGQDVKLADEGLMIPPIPAFQLFVPNYALNYPSDIGLISQFAHRCKDHALTDLTMWTTMGEQLAQAREYQLMGPLNPYMGVLDPSQYVLGGDGFGPSAAGLLDIQGLPSELRVPLATRVFDLFEGTPRLSTASLAQGIINVNTAPAEVLELLPLVAPDDTIGSYVPTPTNVPARDYPRLRLMLQYRDPVDSGGMLNPSAITNILGLREDPLGVNPSKGFVSIGELAALAQWNADQLNMPAQLATPNDENTNGFLLFGANAMAETEYPLETRKDTAPLAPGRSTGDFAAQQGVSFNPFDDPEERLTVFREISNIATTRSDVFMAWFIVRGYDPDSAERIQVLGNDWEGGMNDNLYRPTYESRWLAVFDRSRITDSVDRPKLLLLVELPSTTP